MAEHGPLDLTEFTLPKVFEAFKEEMQDGGAYLAMILVLLDEMRGLMKQMREAESGETGMGTTL